jgi:hypothetical protein
MMLGAVIALCLVALAVMAPAAAHNDTTIIGCDREILARLDQLIARIEARR